MTQPSKNRDHDPGESTSPATHDDAGRSVRLTGDGAGDSAWQEFIAQLGSRGPTYERYVHKGEIARGGMGVIHRVYDQDGRRQLAMKVILGKGDTPPSGGTPLVDDRTLGRFLEEAQVTCQLDHPGIVPVHEIGVDAAKNVYFTMKLAKGEDLRSVFERVHDEADDAWNQTRALSVIQRVCEAMAYAHDKQVVHRDLKPGNVMVGKFGEVYVMDWGLARVLGQEDKKDIRLRDPRTASQSVMHSDRRGASNTPDEALLTMDGDIVGTPAYMPLEQAEGRIEEVGPAADIYALGAMLYHLLSGHMPYVRTRARKSNQMILAEVNLGPPAPIGSEAPDAPGELIAICEKAMSREIAGRYADMTEFARDIRAFLEDRVVAAYESGAWAELKKWVKRNKALAATAMSALVAVLALSGWAWVEREKAKTNEAAAKTEAARADENLALASDRAEEAEAARNTAQRERDNAQRERDNVLRLSDARRLTELTAGMAALWPAYPDKIAAMEAWLSAARALLANLPDHERKLTELRRTGTAQELAPEGPELTAAASRLAGLKEHLALHDGDSPDDTFDDPKVRAEHVAEEQAAITELEAGLPGLRAVDLEHRERIQDYDYGDDVNARWWHDALRDLVVGLHAFQAEDRFSKTLASVAWRKEFASTVEERTTTGPDAVAAWEEARLAILEHPAYGGLSITPQLGLVPLGADPDPTTGHLWEFWHVQSGDRPVRDQETGRWLVTGETGLVFVLIPGGTFWMGAQRTDEGAPNYDPGAEDDESNSEGEAVEVTLAPYFLSKYELTQGQWAEMTGQRPSQYGPGSTFGGKATSLSHPVERVSWEDCQEWLPRSGLKLPTESQWECGARGGTSTRWWTGVELVDLDEAGNLADSYCRDNGGISSWTYEGDLNDGFVVHAPVGLFRANAFGLHDVIGNVYEWCEDSHSRRAYDGEPADGDGAWNVPSAANRVYRGGGWYGVAANARSALRLNNAPVARIGSLGVRPARVLSTD